MIKYLLAAFLLFPSIAQAQDDANAPIVVELFTSQSCSSCPPADRILGEISQDNDNIIALSCNVTYWNHLHWEDTLSQDSCTKRQRNYTLSLNSRGPYTPQIVINGRYEMVGSREGSVKKAIKNAKTPLKKINLRKDSKNLYIALPAMVKEQYIVTLMAYGDEHTQSIPSGENSGRTVKYTNPVTKIMPLNTWDGTKGTMELANIEIEGDKNIVVVIHQQSPTGPIVAAGKLSL